MSSSIRASRIEWFGNAHQDARYLDLWRSTPVSYMPGQTLGIGQHSDSYEQVLAKDESGELFHRAVDRLMRYHFYPPDVMVATSDFSVADRWLRVGDRIVQRVRLLYVFAVPVIELLTMNEIMEVINQPRRRGFTCVTTHGHSEMGQWSAEVEWRVNGDVVLQVRALSKAAWPLLRLISWLARMIQLRAHARGIESFRNSVVQTR